MCRIFFLNFQSTRLLPSTTGYFIPFKRKQKKKPEKRVGNNIAALFRCAFFFLHCYDYYFYVFLRRRRRFFSLLRPSHAGGFFAPGRRGVALFRILLQAFCSRPSCGNVLRIANRRTYIYGNGNWKRGTASQPSEHMRARAVPRARRPQKTRRSAKERKDKVVLNV